MPIEISKYSNPENNKNREKVAWLSDDSWELPEQLEILEKWLAENKSLPKGFYAADIGFAPREGALGGGGVVSLSSMSIMTSIGMSLYFSEYPEGTGK